MPPLEPALFGLPVVPTFDDDLPVYPLSFPVADRQPYSYSVDMGLARSDFAAGNSRQRRTFRNMPHAMSLAFTLRVDDLFVWQNWVNAHAFGWFHCPVSTMYAGQPPDPDNIRFEILRFTTDLAVQMIGWNLVVVGVGAELSGDAFANSPPFGAGGWVVGGTPAAPSPDWIVGGTPAAPSLDWIIAGTPAGPAVPFIEGP